MLGVMFFSLCFGIALTTIGDKALPVISFLEGVYEAVMVIIRFAMRLAPIRSRWFDLCDDRDLG